MPKVSSATHVAMPIAKDVIEKLKEFKAVDGKPIYEHIVRILREKITIDSEKSSG